MSRSKYSWLIAALGTFLMAGCEAPHSNPFDPSSAGYKPPPAPPAIVDLGVSEITSTTALLTWTAPAGAALYLLYHNQPGWDGRSSQGAVLYEGILPGVKPAGSIELVSIMLPSPESRTWAVFSRSAERLLSTGSNPVTITPTRRDRIGIITAKAYSIFTSSWSPPDLIELSLEAVISDSDGVDSVWAATDLGNLDTLSLTGDGITWSTRIAEYKTPTGVLEDIIGRPITIHYRDEAGFVAQSPPIFLARVIYIPPIIDSPVYDDTVHTAQPRLTWFPYNTEYSFTFNVDIDFVSIPTYDKTPAYRKYGIDGDSTGHTIEESLTVREGFYLWTLSVKDEFGDQAFCRESKFWIVDGE